MVLDPDVERDRQVAADGHAADDVAVLVAAGSDVPGKGAAGPE